MELITDENGINQIFRPSPAMTVRTHRRADRIRDALLTSPADPVRVLEIGCGTAEMSFLVANHPRIDLTAADISPKFIEAAQAKPARPNIHFQLADVTAPAFLEQHAGQFDFVIGNGILHHLVNNIDGVFKNLRVILKPGGRLVFWEPNLQNPLVYFMFGTKLGRKLMRLDPDEMAFTRGWIRERLLRNGYVVHELRCRDFLLPNTPSFLIRPVVWLGELLERTPFSFLAQSLFLVATKSDSAN